MQSGLYFDLDHFSGAGNMLDDIVIDTLEYRDVDSVSNLIRRNIIPFATREEFSVSVVRRSQRLFEVYRAPGCKLFVARLQNHISGDPVACAGLGTLHGLPLSEGVGEIRDLVVDSPFRGKGVGRRLLRACIDAARKVGYTSLYLETSVQMEKARKLFLRSGFRPVIEKYTEAPTLSSDIPCYFIMDKLENDQIQASVCEI